MELSLQSFGDTASQAFGLVAVASGNGTPFQGDLQVARLGDVRIGTIAAAPHTVTRSPRLIRSDDTELYKVALVVDGYARIDQDGRGTELGPSELVVYDTTRPYELTFAGNNRLIVVGVPRSMLRAPRGLTGSMTARRLTTTAGTGRLVGSFLRNVESDLTDLSRGDHPGGHRLAAVLADLLDLTLGEIGAQPEVLPVPVLDRILAYCAANLTDPGLSPASIAAAHRISPRYLNKLFAGIGETPAAYLRRMRLDAVRRTLADPGYAAVPISTIAAQYGLADPPNFIRMFRAAYGCTPGQYRASLMADAPPRDKTSLT